MPDPGPGTLAVYVHWPFCRSKCPYCDFNSHVGEGVDEGRWRAALLGELACFAAETRGRTVSSLFFGGGTPSLMEPATVAAVIDAVAGHWPVAADVEITLEANPTSAEAARFAALRAAGVGRLSIGVQAWDDRALGFLGRTHSAAEARAAVAMAAARFPRFSFDLIYGLPGQSPTDWRRQLAEAAALAGDHLSAYQLTVAPGTLFHRRRVAEIDAESAADLYEATGAVLAAAGLPAYEVSNHARPGGACRHNLSIWRGGDYLGIGPGAHGRLTLDGTTAAIRQLRAPEKWLAAVERRGHGTATRIALEAHERREELVLTALRLREGIDRRRFRRLAACEPEAVLAAAGLARMVEGGFLVRDDAGIRATAAGRQRLNAVLAQLLA
ncbi:MAG: radical SAM family heme chaperone HemW [Rhodospirillales bacterium]